MSGPDRIWAYEINYPISKVHGEKRWVPWEPKPITLQMREGFFGRKTRQIPQVFHEYIRRDPAVLAALPEVQALIAGAFEAAAKLALPEERGSQVDPTEFAAGCRHNGLRLNAAIRAMTPADALAARDAMIAAAEVRIRAALADPSPAARTTLDAALADARKAGKLEGLREAKATAEALPRRKEPLGGQTTSYVQLETVAQAIDDLAARVEGGDA